MSSSDIFRVDLRLQHPAIAIGIGQQLEPEVAHLVFRPLTPEHTAAAAAADCAHSPRSCRRCTPSTARVPLGSRIGVIEAIDMLPAEIPVLDVHERVATCHRAGRRRLESRARDSGRAAAWPATRRRRADVYESLNHETRLAWRDVDALRSQAQDRRRAVGGWSLKKKPIARLHVLNGAAGLQMQLRRRGRCRARASTPDPVTRAAPPAPESNPGSGRRDSPRNAASGRRSRATGRPHPVDASPAVRSIRMLAWCTTRALPG